MDVLMQTHSDHFNKKQIAEMTYNHFVQIHKYLNIETERVSTSTSDMITRIIDRAEEILMYHSDEYNADNYWDAIECIYHLRKFLKLVGQELDNEFYDSSLGKLLNAIVDWCRNTDNKQQQEFVWRAIAPAQPDSLVQIDVGIYEARWWTPVPLKDISIIQRKKIVQVIGKPYEPDHLPNGLAIQFTILRSKTS